MDELIRYSDRAKWLPRSVRETIEVSMPCRPGVVHEWDHLQIDISTFGNPGAYLHHWRCTGCGLSVSTDPEELLAA